MRMYKIRELFSKYKDVHPFFFPTFPNHIIIEGSINTYNKIKKEISRQITRNKIKLSYTEDIVKKIKGHNLNIFLVVFHIRSFQLLDPNGVLKSLKEGKILFSYNKNIEPSLAIKVIRFATILRYKYEQKKIELHTIRREKDRRKLKREFLKATALFC